MELLAPKSGERILDMGCGDGALTGKLAAMGCNVVGVDSSGEQIQAARRRGLDVCIMDGHQLSFNEEFDAVFSNAALHWMKSPNDVIAGVRRALKPSGRFVAEFGGYGCIAKVAVALYSSLTRRGIDAAAINPWYFPTIDDYGARLACGGFDVTWIALIPRPTVLPGKMTGWLETFAETFTSALPPQDRAPFLSEVQEALRPDLCTPEGKWVVDYVRLQFSAVRREE